MAKFGQRHAQSVPRSSVLSCHVERQGHGKSVHASSINENHVRRRSTVSIVRRKVLCTTTKNVRVAIPNERRGARPICSPTRQGTSTGRGEVRSAQRLSDPRRYRPFVSCKIAGTWQIGTRINENRFQPPCCAQCSAFVAEQCFALPQKTYMKPLCST